MTANTRTGTGHTDVPLRGDSLTGNARCRGLPIRERGTARTAHSTPDTLDGKAAP
ncbi:hypothetical protein [Streptomyces sp. NBC_00459]|uniref:hypothetical protein n=1 Tax=Streptomyces sp. NBC_00459 TaxID=2975749 RepID=UPI002E188FAC